MASALALPMQPQPTKATEVPKGDSAESGESNTDPEEGATPLMYASQQGRDNVVQQMLAAEMSSALARDRTGKTALHYCCEQAGPSTAALLLAAASSLLDARDQDGYAPITLAVIAGNRTLVRYLLARGADVNTSDAEQHSVVHWATVCGDAASLELVIGAGAIVSTPDLHGGYPIHYAAQLCGPQGAAAAVSSDPSGATVCRGVTDRGAGLAVLRTLLAAGASVSVKDHDGRQPLLWAASAGSADAILALVNAGAEIEAEDKDGLTALHCAASRGHTDCVETLVSLCGAHVDVIDSNGCTALFYAVTLGHADATRLLLRRGAEPNRQDRKGRTAAHCGAAKGQLETLRILSAHGANLWLRNVRGDFPLHDAVQSGRSDLVRWLLAFKQTSNLSSAADATNNDGRTPLHVAALHNNIEICKILLDAHCLLNPTMRTNRHQLLTPLDAALLRGNRGCAKFLQLHGGVPASRLTENLARLRATGRSPPPKQPDGGSPEPSPPDRSSGQMDLQSRTFQVHMKDDILQVGAPVVVCHHVTRSAPGSDGECAKCGQHCCKRSLRRRTQTDIQRWRRRERLAKRREARLRDTSHNSSYSDEDDYRSRSGKDSAQKSTLSDGDSPIRVRKRTSFVQVDDGAEMRYSDGEAVHRGRRNAERTTREGTSARKSRRHEKRSRSARSNDNLDTNQSRQKEDGKATRTKGKHNVSEAKEISGKEREKQESRRSDSLKSSRDTKRRTKSDDRSVSSKKSHVKTSEHDSIVEKNSKRKSKGHSPQRDVEIRSTTVLNVEKSLETNRETEKVDEVGRSLSKRYSTDDSSPAHVSTRTVVTAVVHRENASSSSEEGSSDKNGKNEQSTSTEDAKAVVEESSGVEKNEEEEHDRKDEKARKREGEEGKRKDERKSEDLNEGYKDSKEGKEKRERKSRNVEEKTAELPEEQVVREEQKKEGREVKDSKVDTEEYKKESRDVKDSKVDKEEYKKESRDAKDSEVGKEEHTKEGHPDVKDSSIGREERTKEGRDVENSGVGREEREKEDRELKEESAMEDESKRETLEELGIEEESKRSELEQSSTFESESKTESMDVQVAGNEEEISQLDVSREDGADEKDGGVNEEASLVEPIDSSSRVQHSSETPQASRAKPVTRVSRVHQSDDKEKRQTRPDVQRAGRYASSNFRKEKNNNVRQVKKIVTSKSSYSVSSKRHVGKVIGRSKEAPAFTIDVDDFSGRSPNEQLVDSGLEPSPRRETDKEGRMYNQSASLEGEVSDSEQRREYTEKTGKFDAEGSGRKDGHIGNGEEISVTRAVQMSMRKYHLERRIFHELLELKRLQIRAGRANEQVLVKRLVDDYRRAGLCVGLQQYTGTYTFRSFEKYLYEQLRALQATGQRVVPRLQSSDDLERLTAALRRTRARHGSPPDDPLLCTLSTHRCHHALHAYSGVPCAAYIPRLNHHTIPKEDLDNPGAHARAHATPRTRSNVSFLPLIDGRQSEIGHFSRLVDSSRPVTLQLSHGQEKQVISLPTERLDKHKRYYVTFTIKGGNPASTETNAQDDHPDATAEGNKENTAVSFRLHDSQSVPSKLPRHGKSF